MSPAEQLEQDLQAAVEGRDHVGLVHALGALAGVDPERCEHVWLALEVGLAYRAAVAPMIEAVAEHLDEQLSIEDVLEAET